MDHEAPLTDTPTPPSVSRQRRRHSAAFKTQVLAECEQPGASVAGVALRHNLNPNLVQKWRRSQRRETQSDFLRLPAPTQIEFQGLAQPHSTTLRIELPSPKGPIIVHWPMSEIKQSVAWLRALIK